MNRRDILKTGLASSVLTAFPISGILSNNFQWDSSKRVYGDYTLLLKHGQAAHDEKFYYCVCDIVNNIELNERIAEVLHKNGYRSRLSYSSNDRHKIIPGIEIIEMVAKSSDIKISIFEILSAEANLKNIKPTEYIERVAGITKACMAENSSLQIIAKQEGSSAYSNFSKDTITIQTGKEVQWANVHNDKTLQAMELVTGCIYADLANKRLEASAKIELRNAARKVYGVDAFSINIESENLSVKRLKI